MAEITPMKKQYNEIKSQHEDCLLFYRLGDFYEMFDDDAKLASRILDLALTTRDRGKPEEEQTPMCGVPYHSAEAYIGRLIAKGYKVAICEQMEDPKAVKGIVGRDVVRIISPGTVIESSMLEEGRSNYLAAVYLHEGAGAVAFSDISTGEFCVSAFPEEAAMHIQNELGRFAPKEAIVSAGAYGESELPGFLRDKLRAVCQKEEARFDYALCAERVCRQFGVLSPAELGLSDDKNAVIAAGALLSYILDTQKCDISHINRLELFSRDKYMELDYNTLRNLELTQNLHMGEKRFSLLWVLDETKTPMGARMLRSWVERPLLNPGAIGQRLAAVGELAGNAILRAETMQCLKEIGDMRRVAGKAVYGTANGKDLNCLGRYCQVLPEIRGLLSGCSSRKLQRIAGLDLLQDMGERILSTICDNPPFSVREGGIIREGFNEEVDYLRAVKENGAQMVRDLEARERERTGIRKLKVGYNKVFGYYIDVPRSAGEAALPEEYIRKQTLVSNERYFTPELKDLENTLLSAGDRLSELEFDIYDDLRAFVAEQVERVQFTADNLAELDCYCSLAEVAVRNGWTRPDVDWGDEIRIVEGRHPVVEKAQNNRLFVPNDSLLNCGDHRVAIITGPNMAGKSTFMRQTAIITLLAQMGSFVPAKHANIGVADHVFTRIGASDDLAAGRSTFMVEMNEVAFMLEHATARSLLILDEIGRGTSTYDGMAIARAVLEHCADAKKLGARTMFATHYHELSALEGQLEGVRNYNITAKKLGEELVFLRKIVPGAADRSYGIEVAKLAGLPPELIKRAEQYLSELEGGKPRASGKKSKAEPEREQISLADLGNDEVREKLRKTDPNAMTPIEALNLVYELKKICEM